MKIFNLLFFLFFSILYSQTLQKVKIVDEQGGTPISNALILLANEVLYTNDDGEVLIPNNINNIEVTKSGYMAGKLSRNVSLLKMKPLYKDIEEVKIVNVDVKKIFEDVFKKYTKLYFSEPSLYDIIYKQKNTDDDNLSFLLIAEANLWTSSNFYNFKFQNDYDKFIQIGLNNIKYYKIVETENGFSQGSSLDQSKDFVGNIFFNYELKRLISYLAVKDVKYSGRLINESGNDQLINFKTSSSLMGINVFGNMIYNKLDKVITRYEMNYDQSTLPSYKRRSANGVDYELKLGNGVVTFEFYKNNNKYIPSLSSIKGDSYILYDGKKQVKTFDREIIFQKFSETKKEGLENKIDFNIKLWENIPDKEKKDSKILLSEEEQKFINEKK